MSYGYITDYLKRNSSDKPNKLALVTEDKQLTWRELYDEVAARAGYFVEYGNRKQLVFGILMPNTWQFVVTYLAIIEAGHIAMPLDVIYKTIELDAIVEQMHPVAVICDEQNIGRIGENAKKELFDNIKSNFSGEALRLPDTEQIATLVFTSGTTGKPKAAPHTHNNHLWNIDVCSEAWEWGNEDTMLISLRLSHWYGICMGLSGAIYLSNTLFLQDGFSAKSTLEKLSSGKITLFTHTPIAYKKMLEEEGDYDLSHTKILVSGSAPLPPSTWKEFSDRFGKKILETYGSSETGRIAANPLNDPRPGSPGKLLRGVEAKINNHQELLVKSPGLFPGYFKNAQATKQELDSEGYWHTGDIAEIQDGRVILKGRTHERIRRQGYSISPRDIEWALLKDVDIKECAVLGAPGEDSEDRLIYFIVGDVSDDELAKHQKENLPSVWRSSQVIRLDKLPRTPMGKVNLPALRAMID